MPCQSQLGELEIRLDSQDRIRSFVLTRRNCRVSNGNLSILPHITGQKPGAIINGRLIDFLPAAIKRSGPIMLLLENQYSALVLALLVYLGRLEPKAEIFSILSIGRDDGDTIITGVINLRSDWQEILGCRHCAGTASRKSRK